MVSLLVRWSVFVFAPTISNPRFLRQRSLGLLNNESILSITMMLRPCAPRNEEVTPVSDTLSALERSRLMSRIHSKDTQPEMIVRRIAHKDGYRYRLHVGDLPGKPDLVFPSRRKVIFVHGCFWHGHEGCKRGRQPQSNQKFWLAKLQENKLRDMSTLEQLTILGWKVLIIWGCELNDPDAVRCKIRYFLN
jgi:DNA mismatch endonuclease (patch repair protein)